MATAYFLQLLTQMSDAETDQEHMEIRMISNPATPDRTKFILGESTDSPLPLYHGALFSWGTGGKNRT